jgi:hypothetical protein
VNQENPVNDAELRALVRQSVARALGQPGVGVPGAPSVQITGTGHSSHFRYALPESDGPCLIEPSVPCNHCGYCQSHGH